MGADEGGEGIRAWSRGIAPRAKDVQPFAHWVGWGVGLSRRVDAPYVVRSWMQRQKVVLEIVMGTSYSGTSVNGHPWDKEGHLGHFPWYRLTISLTPIHRLLSLVRFDLWGKRGIGVFTQRKLLLPISLDTPTCTCGSHLQATSEGSDITASSLLYLPILPPSLHSSLPPTHPPTYVHQNEFITHAFLPRTKHTH